MLNYNIITPDQIYNYYVHIALINKDEPFKRFIGCKVIHNTKGNGIIENIYKKDNKSPRYYFSVLYDDSSKEQIDFEDRKLTIFRIHSITDSYLLYVYSEKEIDLMLSRGNGFIHLDGCLVYDDSYGFGFISGMDNSNEVFVAEYEFCGSVVYTIGHKSKIFANKFGGKWEDFISLMK